MSFLSLRAIRFILRRYLMSSWLTRRSRSRAAFAVVIPMLGVSVGVAAFVVVLSVMGGFVKNLKSKLLALEPHVEIVSAGEDVQFEAKPEILEAVRKASSEVVSVSPFQRGDAILQSPARPATVLLMGIVPDDISSEFSAALQKHDPEVLKREIPSSDGDPVARFQAVVVGSQLLFQVGAEPGDRLTLVSISPDEGPGGMAPTQFPVVVADTLRSGNPAFDGKWVLGSLDFVNSFFGTEGSWAGLRVRVRDPLDLDDVLPRLDKAVSPFGLRSKPWTEANKALVHALKLERWGMSFVMFVVILVACFSITISLVLAVKRKAREMAILRAVGIRKIDLGLVFLLHGFCVGLLGAGLGLLSGLGILSLLRSGALRFVTASYGDKPLPVLLDWGDLSMVTIGSVLLAMVAAVWPALEVARIDVVETLSDRG